MLFQTELTNSLSLPIIAAPMFLVSSPQLVIECCRNGIVGSFPALNQRSSEGYEAWLEEIQSELAPQDAPYAVNLIVHKTNSRLESDLDLTVKHKVPIVITSLGAVKEVVDAVHSYGGLVFHDVTTVRFAERALEAGVDGLIAVCAGAGGHAGTYNPFAFIPELRVLTDKTIIASGCIGTGGGVLAALNCGADFAYVGTRLIAANESLASDAYKDMLIQTQAADIIYTPKISGVNASFIRSSIQAAGIDLNVVETPAMDIEHELSGNAKAWKDIWSAGQGVGQITQLQSVGDIICSLSEEYQTALQRSRDICAKYVS